VWVSCCQPEIRKPLHGGSQTLHYEVVPGSGSGQLDGLTGILHLNIDEDGTHHYELEYEL